MPDVHVPHLEDDHDSGAAASPPCGAGVRPSQAPERPSKHSKSFLKIGLEILLISVGVFLGLMGEQWRGRVEHRELAEASVRRFRVELQNNRAAVAGVKDKHLASLTAIEEYFRADAAARQKLPWPDSGTNPAFLEYSAWDLALATQSLAYLDADLALAIAHVYAAQRQLDEATHGITQSMYAVSDPVQFLANGLHTYFGDCTLLEPRLLKIYDEILPHLDRALGETATPAATH